MGARPANSRHSELAGVAVGRRLGDALAPLRKTGTFGRGSRTPGVESPGGRSSVGQYSQSLMDVRALPLVCAINADTNSPTSA